MSPAPDAPPDTGPPAPAPDVPAPPEPDVQPAADVPPPTLDAGRWQPELGPTGPGRGPLAGGPPNTTCRLPVEPLPNRMATEPIYPELSFDRPLWFGFAPDGSARRYVVEQDGRIFVFDDRDDVDEADVFVDLRSQVRRSGNEEGLLGLAFHPGYAQNRRLFIYYSASGPRRSVLSELLRDEGNPRRASAASERVILEVPQPAGNHNGGDIRFGPDGYLYISLGDGGGAGDSWNNAQRPSRLLGSILRIDVDGQAPYEVPPDNPFASPTRVEGDDRDARPEVWAYGMRNAWRMSFDTPTGDLWVGDVGQGRWEEVGRITGGGNHGWRQREGFECYVRPPCIPSADVVPPVAVYGRDEGVSVTGGHVYRGAQHPELFEAYVFGDYSSGRIWALRHQDGRETRVSLLVDTRHRISSFGLQPDGELVIVDFRRGRSLHRLLRVPGVVPGLFPRTLSETGCFADTRALEPAPGVIPYDLRVPLWSDGATKRRWLALPEGGAITYSADEAYGFPLGTVLLKHFELDEFGREAPRRLETRLLVRRAEGWQGYAYKWAEDQADAHLLEGAEAEAVVTPRGEQTWRYPSRANCDACHTDAAGNILGWRTAQLNRAFPYDGGAFNQLAALAGAGLLELPEEPADLPAHPAPDDDSAPGDLRARATLDVNCAMCHRPGAPGNAAIDLRAGLPLAEMNVCGVEPGQGDLGVDGARIVAPGDPGRSLLLQRMRASGDGRMPPLASEVVDPVATVLVRAWIERLEQCPAGP